MPIPPIASPVVIRTSPSGGQRRLHDGGARPRVLPEQLRRRPARRWSRRLRSAAGSGHAADRHQMRRAVAAARRFGPSQRWLPVRAVVGDELAARRRRRRGRRPPAGSCEAPARDRRAGVGRRVARPHDRAVARVERVQDSGRAERVDATVAERRRAARTGAAVRLPEPDRVAVSSTPARRCSRL